MQESDGVAVAELLGDAVELRLSVTLPDWDGVRLRDGEPVPACEGDEPVESDCDCDGDREGEREFEGEREPLGVRVCESVSC